MRRARTWAAALLCGIVTACGGGGGGGGDPAPAPAPAPAITEFTASPEIVTAGDPVLLTATFTGGTGAVNFGVGPVSSGDPILVVPSATTALTLRVTGADGAVVQALGGRVLAEAEDARAGGRVKPAPFRRDEGGDERVGGAQRRRFETILPQPPHAAIGPRPHLSLVDGETEDARTADHLIPWQLIVGEATIGVGDREHTVIAWQRA